jgi:hypothetical protein
MRGRQLSFEWLACGSRRRLVAALAILALVLTAIGSWFARGTQLPPANLEEEPAPWRSVPAAPEGGVSPGTPRHGVRIASDLVRQQAASDDGWSKIPRNSKPLDPLLLDLPQSGAKVAAWLFRNTGCNPRDVFIPEALRSQFVDQLSQMEKNLASCYQDWVNAYAAEFEAAVASGNGVQKDLVPVTSQGRLGPVVGVSLAEMQARGLDMYSIRDGVVHAFAIASSPRARATRDQQRFVELDHSRAVLRWFHAVGALSAEELASLEGAALQFSIR